MRKRIASNCMVSHAILYPDKEILGFNGLAWSNIYGVIHETRTTQQSNPAQWLGNQE